MKIKLNKTKVFKLIILIITIGILIAATIYLFPVLKQLNTAEGQAMFKEKVESSKVYGLLMLFGLEVAQMFLAILPGEPIEILAGICYGSIWGTIFIMISILITTSIIYFVVKKYGKKVIYGFFPKEKVDKFENSKIFKDQKKIEMVMILLFLIPGTPKDLFVYFGGLLPIKTTRFLIIATVLRIPSVISSTIAGSNMLQGKWNISILAYVITFAITFIVILIINIFDKNKTTKDVISSMNKRK